MREYNVYKSIIDKNIKKEFKEEFIRNYTQGKNSDWIKPKKIGE